MAFIEPMHCNTPNITYLLIPNWNWFVTESFCLHHDNTAIMACNELQIWWAWFYITQLKYNKTTSVHTNISTTMKYTHILKLWSQMVDTMQATFSDTFFSFENCCVIFKFRTFPLKDAINNIPALFQIITWCQTASKPLSESMRAEFTDTYMHTQPQSVNICQTMNT